MSQVLATKDVNSAMSVQEPGAKPEIKSMEYHRQILQNKMSQDEQQYISPSDNIMSPCTAKLNALRNKQVGKVTPKSLFAKASSKKLGGEGLFGSKPKSPPNDN